LYNWSLANTSKLLHLINNKTPGCLWYYFITKDSPGTWSYMLQSIASGKLKTGVASSK